MSTRARKPTQATQTPATLDDVLRELRAMGTRLEAIERHALYGTRAAVASAAHLGELATVAKAWAGLDDDDAPAPASNGKGNGAAT